jgi:cobalamin biosynthesis protein CobT
MSLFLTEDLIHSFLLSEADDTDTTDPKGDDAEDDTKDSGADKGDSDADTTDSTADTADAADEGGDGGDTSADEGDGVDPAGGADAEPPVPKRKPSKFAIEVEDTPQNRLFLMEKFESLKMMHTNVRQFIDNLKDRMQLGDKQIKILDQIALKMSANLAMLEQLVDDELYSSLEIADIFGLYKIYFSDVRNSNQIIRSILASSANKNKPGQKNRR